MEEENDDENDEYGCGVENDDDSGVVVPRPPAAWFELEESMAEAAIEAADKVCELQEEEITRRGGNRLSLLDNDGNGEDDGGGNFFDKQKHAAATAAARRVLFSWLDQEELLPSPEFPVEEPPPSSSLDAGVAASVAAAATSTSFSSSPTTTTTFCSLAPAPTGRRFARRDLRAYLSRLFHSIPEARRRDKLPPVSLSRFDLFHAHFFLSGVEPLLLLEDKKKKSTEKNKNKKKEKMRAAASASLGLLFHAAEYPALCPLEFPHDLGRCQRGSDVPWSEEAAEWRTLVAARGRLASVRLGAGAGGGSGDSGSGIESSGSDSGGSESSGSTKAVVADSLVWPELREMRTLLESDLGIWLDDVVLCVGDGGGRKESSGKEDSELCDVLVYVPGMMF